jgi:hypothetical protein
MARVRFLPQDLVVFVYSTMAPYQGYNRDNDELRAQGQLPDGSWETIDVRRYYPLGHGWESLRMRLRSFRTKEFDDPSEVPGLLARYEDLGRLLLAAERRRGMPYESVRLTWESWPLSPLGYDALRLPAFVTTEEITSVAL